MKVNKYIIIVLLIGLLKITSHACGPFFPDQLLVDRKGTMLNLQEGTFYYETAHFVKPQEGLFFNEPENYLYTISEKAREMLETAWFGKRAETLISEMRKCSNAEVAYAAGAGLPEEIRQYTAGAVAFNNRDREIALRYFSKVLQLPEQKRKHVHLWAQYMIGRCHSISGDSMQAIQAYQSVRNLAAQGQTDSLGLTVASFGEEARIHLERGNYPLAVQLYAEQAATGSLSGAASLLMVAREIIASDSLLHEVLPDTTCQKLVFSYLYCRGNEVNDSLQWLDSANSERLLHILDIVENDKVTLCSYRDKLSAASYRAGRFDLADRLSQEPTTGLSWWVRAKINLRKGNTEEAVRDYREAIKYFPEHENTYSSEGVTTKRVGCELSTVYLARGEFLAAMKWLYGSSPTYWMDAAYVAEKILTIEELKKFVDEYVKTDTIKNDDQEYYWGGNNPAAALRYLLARRLLREKQFDNAPDYFDDGVLKQKAKKYIELYRNAKSSRGVKSASFWFAAAKLIRFDGMELLGYELDPDYHVFSGEYSLETDYPDTLSKAYMTSEELTRLERFKKTDRRFHYRFVAIDYVMKATAQVPPRSQAYVAMLSKAYWWICNNDADLGQKLYTQYVRNGAYVPWAFSYLVPEPDFKKAQEMVRAEQIRNVKQIFKSIVKRIKFF